MCDREQEDTSLTVKRITILHLSGGLTGPGGLSVRWIDGCGCQNKTPLCHRRVVKEGLPNPSQCIALEIPGQDTRYVQPKDHQQAPLQGSPASEHGTPSSSASSSGSGGRVASTNSQRKLSLEDEEVHPSELKNLQGGGLSNLRSQSQVPVLDLRRK